MFTPFNKAWLAHGWPGPALEPPWLRLASAPSDPTAWQLLDTALAECPIRLPAAGEAAAMFRWRTFLDRSLATYDGARDRPDLDGTSRLSPYLKFGVVHPRTLLSDLAGRRGAGAQRYRTELAWREFYADVLLRFPTSLTTDLNPIALDYDESGPAFDAWRDGRTGFPIVDAGMRQLLAEGWVHNRVRMITASFHPEGDYVRRHVPELRHLAGAAVHRPWDAADGHPNGYPERIVDHAEERLEALARFKAARG